MLKEFVEKGRFCFHGSFDNWEDSIRASCKPLIDEGVCESIYAETIIDCVKKYGPYIIIIPNVALPHAQEGALGVHDTAISFMKVETPVKFDPDDSEKDAKLFFVLASVNHDKHLENMAKLSDMLMNEDLVNELMNAKSEKDLLALDEKYISK